MALRNGGSGGRKRTQGSRADATLPDLRVESRAEAGAGPAIRILLSNGARGRNDYDLTRAFTAAVAHALWTVRAGDDAQNWIDAEHLLEHLFGAPSTRPERRPAAREESVTGPLPDADVLSRFRSRGTVTKT